MRLFATASLMLLLPAAGVASDRYHVVTPSFGCVVPWTTWALNDKYNRHRHDPRWLNRVIGRGGCRLVSPIQEWERVGRIGRLVLLRQVPPHVGATPLLFRPSDLRVGEVADPAPAAPEAATPAAPPEPAAASPVQPDPAQGTAQGAAQGAALGAAQGANAPPPAATAAPSEAAAPPPSAAPSVASPPAAPPPPVAAPLPVAGSPSGKQAPAPATPDAVPSSTSSTGSGPATQAPPAAATQEPPVVATPLPDLPAATAVPAPAPEAATPAPAPAPPVPPPAPTPVAPAPDAVAHPPAAVPAHAAGIPLTSRPTKRRNRLVGLVAILALLAALIVIGLLLVRRRRETAERSHAERHDARPELPADQAEVPAIDNNAYRQWCVDSLTEAGWQARMSFPAGRLTADIMARRDGRLLTVQCRPSTRPLEAAVVQEALVVRRAQDAQVAAVVSNAGYTRAARNLAAASGVRLLHETELTEFVS